MIERQIDIPSDDGTIDALVVRPDTADALPGVINLTDGLGFRQAFADQSKRIAEHGYVVLTPNIFYRTTKPPVFDFEPDFQSERTIKRFRELTGPLTPAAMARDTTAYVDALACERGVGPGPMGVVGFCFAGQFALRAAAARPDRIRAAASFHGAGLVTDSEQSPHATLSRVKARLYFGHAENDRGMPPEAIDALGKALRAWGGSYENEMYVGARHGWMIPGGKVYAPEQSERGFAKLIALFDDALHAPIAAGSESPTT